MISYAFGINERVLQMRYDLVLPGYVSYHIRFFSITLDEDVDNIISIHMGLTLAIEEKYGK